MDWQRGRWTQAPRWLQHEPSGVDCDLAWNVARCCAVYQPFAVVDDEIGVRGVMVWRRAVVTGWC